MVATERKERLTNVPDYHDGSPLISQPTYSIIIIYLDDYITLTYLDDYIT